MDAKDQEELLKIIRQTFFDEAATLLDDFEGDLLSLETDENKEEVIARMFRTAHSLKGSAASVEFKAFSQFAHHLEDCMSEIREKPFAVSSSVITLFLHVKDLMAKWLEIIPDDAEFVPEERDELVERLKVATQKLSSIKEGDSIGEILLETGKINEGELSAAVKSQEVIRSTKLGEILVQQGAVQEKQIDQALKQQEERRKSKPQVNFLKIDVDRVAVVNELVGELVVIKSQLLNSNSDTELDSQTENLLALLDKTVRELYDSTLQMQMMSMRGMFQKLERTVRDTSIKVDKPIEFRTHGEDTELDRDIVDSLKDSLMHIVRNAVDHGIEPSADREKSGKPHSGIVSLSARRSGSNVVIEVEDDGRGLSRGKIERKAIATGIQTQENLSKMSDQEVYQMVFEPSFSTAEKITDVSGRGVGLDVVKTSVENLKGSIELDSDPGKGSRFRLSLPISTAITDGVVIASNGEKYILPLDSVTEFIPLKEGSVSTLDDGSKVFSVRGQYIPLYKLHEKLTKKDSNGVEELVVVVSARGKKAGFLVDEIIDQSQVVLKSMGSSMEHSEGVAGAAIMGNGKVALVLDVLALIHA